VLVAREQVLVNRHGVAVKGAGPIGGRRSDVAWAAAGIAAVAVVGVLLSVLRPAPATEDALTVTDQGAAATVQPGTGGATQAATRTVHPTTRLGNLSAFAVIVTDLKAKVAKNDLAAGKSRAKDLEVSWDDAEAGLKPRDSTKWHQLDDQIDAVLTALRASNPSQADCAASVTALLATLNTFDGV